MNICQCTIKALRNVKGSCKSCKNTQKNGMHRKKGVNGIRYIMSLLRISSMKLLKRIVCNVLSLSRLKRKGSSVQTLVNQAIEEKAELTTLKKLANNVGQYSNQTSIGRLGSVLQNVGPLRVVKIEQAGEHDVYCLDAEDTHAFAIDGGIIVHNCYDAVRYRCLKGSNRQAKAIKVSFAV